VLREGVRVTITFEDGEPNGYGGDYFVWADALWWLYTIPKVKRPRCDLYGFAKDAPYTSPGQFTPEMLALCYTNGVWRIAPPFEPSGAIVTLSRPQ
jgi:hypothetical protein